MSMNTVTNAIMYAITLIVLGAGLVTYVHANFASKTVVEKLDDRVYQIWTEVVPQSKRVELERTEK